MIKSPGQYVVQEIFYLISNRSPKARGLPDSALLKY